MASMKFIAPEVAETVMDNSVAAVDVVETIEVAVTTEVTMVDIEAVVAAVPEVEAPLVVVDKRIRKFTTGTGFALLQSKPQLVLI
jgi:hypothetical protein